MLKLIGFEVNIKKTEITNVGIAAGNITRDSFSVLLPETKVT